MNVEVAIIKITHIFFTSSSIKQMTARLERTGGHKNSILAKVFVNDGSLPLK